MHIPVDTLPTQQSLKLTKILSKGFKRSVFRNECKSKIETEELDNYNLKRIPLDSSFQGVNRLFVLAFDKTECGANRVERNSHRKYFLLRVNITNITCLNRWQKFL